MSHRIRISLFVAGFTVAVGIGYGVKSSAFSKTGPIQPTVFLNLPKRVATERTEIVSASDVPKLSFSDTNTAADEPVNKNDMAFKIIAKQLGHDTSSVAKNADPSPSVLVQAKQGAIELPQPLRVTGIPTIPVPTLEKVALPFLNEAPIVQGNPILPEQAIAPPLIPPIGELPTLPGVLPPPPHSQSKEPGAVPKLVLNSRDVSFNFSVERVGNSKIKAVELWRQRTGEAWEKYDRKLGSQSPFRSYIGGEGEFGFKLVFESESGLRSPEPDAKTRPDSILEIDTTPPKIQNFRIHNRQDGAIEFCWDVDDSNLDNTATQIQISTDGKGWLPIATGAKELRKFPPGGFQWKPPQTFPHQVFIRLRTRDTAGNESVAELGQKQSIDAVKPLGKITSLNASHQVEVGPQPRLAQAHDAFSFWVQWFQ